MEQAQKFNRPIICLVDTQGAFCGKSAEEGGVGGAIAENLAYMSTLTVPVISVVLGEGGSGGALGLAVANRVAMQENAVYSILSPEGFASILWKDASRASEAAEVMKMCATDALEMGIIDAVIEEGEGSASKSAPEAAAHLWEYLTSTLKELSALTPSQLAQSRYDRFRKF
jgi:acetyl-CoA carboxylase carboxyl transferase subunit beta